MSNYAAQGGYYPNQYVRSMYFAPAPAPQPIVQVVPAYIAPSEQQAAPQQPQQQRSGVVSHLGDQSGMMRQRSSAPLQQTYQRVPQVQPTAPQVQIATVPAPQPQVVPVYSSYAMSVPYQRGASRPAPSAYQYEAPVQRQPSVTSVSEARARQAAAAREVAQRQVEETQAAYHQALQKLSSLGVEAPYEQIQAGQQQMATAAAVPVPQTSAVAVASIVDPVYSSYGYDRGADYGRLQKQMAESMYYGLPNNMVAAYAPPRSPAPLEARTPSRQQSRSSLAAQQGTRFGGALSRSNSTITAIERSDADVRTPKVAHYKLASPAAADAYVDGSMDNCGRPIVQVTSEYSFDTLRGMNAAWEKPQSTGRVGIN